MEVQNTGFMYTISLGSFWANALIQVLITGATVWVAYLIFIEQKKNENQLFELQKMSESQDSKLDAIKQLTKLSDLIFIFRSDIQDEKDSKQILGTRRDFINRDILDDMMKVWTLLSEESQTALIGARTQINLHKGHDEWSRPENKQRTLEELDSVLESAGREIEKDLEKLRELTFTHTPIQEA